MSAARPSRATVFAAGVAGVAVASGVAWAVRPADREPPLVTAGPPAEADWGQTSRLVPVGPPKTPAELRAEDRRAVAALEEWYAEDDFHAFVPLPEGTDIDALRAGTPERTALLGPGNGFGEVVSIGQLVEGEGAPVAILKVSRKFRREVGDFTSAPAVWEWWRLAPDGSAALLRAKSEEDLTAADLPPAGE